MNDIQQSLTHFLERELRVDARELAPDAPLFSSGLIDSFALVTLLGHIEKSCGVQISATDVSLDNFDTLERMVAYVQRSRAA